MTTVTLYWSNICILHKLEKKHLKKVQQELLHYNIDLQVTLFGLGCEWRMADYLQQDAAIIPDIIVSTDLEVFEDERIYSKIKNDLYKIDDWFDFKKQDLYKDLYVSDKYMPFIAIPMVFYSTEKECEKAAITDYKDASIAFGGINNSGAKCILKALWYKYGMDTAKSIGKKAVIKDMPIQAMQSVKKGEVKTALVPSIYALRANNDESFFAVPTDGAIALPSYMAVNKSVDEKVAKMVLHSLITQEFCNSFVENADLLSCIEKTKELSLFDAKAKPLCYPSPAWFNEVNSTEFYELYAELLPSAQIPC